MLKEKDLDIVLIATPDHWHALPMIAAVEAGADVYVQKPISVDVTEGQAMLAAARKHQRVVQVGTQRRSTPHLIEARDRIIREGKLGKIGLVEIYCYYHMRNTVQPARHRARPTTSTGRCGPARPRCGPTTRSSIPAAGGRSWNTATASWATCASTCSTWCAGCSSWAGPSGSARRAASWSTKGARRTSPTRRPPRSISATWTSSGSIAPGASRPTPNIPGAPRSTATRGRLKASVMGYDFIPHGGGTPIHRDVTYELEQFPEDKTEKDLERHVAPAIRGHMKDLLAAIASRGRPVADIEQGYISTAICILANLSMQLGRTLTWDAQAGHVVGDDEANRLLDPALSRHPGSTPHGSERESSRDDAARPNRRTNDLMPDRRTFLTDPDDFTDVSRGNPQPHTLTGEALVKARLTAETWRLEIEAEGEAKIDHPKKLDAGTALDLPGLLALGTEARRQVLEGDAMQQHRPAAGPGAVGGRAAARGPAHRRENARRPPGLLLGLSQQRPQADVPVVAGDQPGARYARRANCPRSSPIGSTASRSRSSAAGRCAWSSPGPTGSSPSNGSSTSRSPTTTAPTTPTPSRTTIPSPI